MFYIDFFYRYPDIVQLLISATHINQYWYMLSFPSRKTKSFWETLIKSVLFWHFDWRVCMVYV